MKILHLVDQKIESVKLVKARGLDEKRSYTKKLVITMANNCRLEVLPVYGSEVLVTLNAMGSFESACHAVFSGECDHLTVAELRQKLELDND